MGSLESEVMEHLWAASTPLTPGMVQDALSSELAYTTVMTILTRLWKKELVTRTQEGRAFAYSPAISEADFLAKRMRDELAKTKDRAAVLSRFVDQLPRREAKSLRAILADLDKA